MLTHFTDKLNLTFSDDAWVALFFKKKSLSEKKRNTPIHNYIIFGKKSEY